MTTHSEMPRLAYLMIITRHRFSGGSETSLRLGRTATKTVGDVETVSYGYNIRSWPTRSESAKFTELMGYNTMLDGRRSMNPQFGGNISALSWKQGNSSYRGYELYYDDYGRLTDASYGEGLAFGNNGNRYDELFGYDRMGNITTLARNGKLDGSLLYGCIDDLEMEYDGNQLTRVYDNESDNDPTYEGAMQFTDNSDEDVEYEYDANGNMTKDLNSNITRIQYNCFNLPSRIYFTNRHVMDYVYNADGELLQMSARALHQLPRPQLDTKYYAGNVIFPGRFLSMLLTDEGSVTFASNGTPTYHYYLRDHLGNVRVVFNQTGTVEQVNHYYPYGGLTGESTGGSVQPYKYNGKELERTAGLDLYDYGARWMVSKIGARFTTMDPMCEKYYGISPYAYCGGNPVNRIDPDGMKDTIFVQGQDKPVSDLPNTETPLFYPDYTINPSAYNCHTFAWSYPNGDPTDIEHQEFPRWDEHPENNMGGYTQLDSNEPNVPDDRVIYYVDVNEDGVFQYGEHISHSAIVYSVDNNGYTTAVISKRGELGISINHPRAPGFYNTDNGRPTSRAYFRENQKYLKMKYSNNTRNSFHNNMGIEKRNKTYVAPKPQVKYK